MRTKEKFYKNLKGYISKEDRIQRLDLRDVKTLDRFVSQSKKIIQEYNDFQKDVADQENEVDIRFNKFKENEKKEKKILADQQKLIARHKKEAESIKKQIAPITENKQKWSKATFEADKLLDKMKGELDTKIKAKNRYADDMQKQIDLFAQGAKALGVDVSAKVSTYKSALSNLRKN